MNEYLLIVIAIIFAFIVAVIFTLTRNLLSNLTSYERVVADSTLGWTILVFGLILSFSIVNFYTRYIDLRNSLAIEATNLNIIYKLIKKIPNSEKAVESMKKYLDYLINVDLKNLKKNKLENDVIDELYSNMNDEIIDLLDKQGQNYSSINILNRLSTNYQNYNFKKEIINNTFYINVIIIMSIFILISLWLIKVENVLIQFLADFCFLSVISIGITLLIILGKPFNNIIIGIDLSNHKQLLKDINNL